MYFITIISFLFLQVNANRISVQSEICSLNINKFIVENNPRIQEIFIFGSICEGIVDPIVSGLFGGFEGVLYFSECDKHIYINARENGFFKSNENYSEIGVPGTLKGYEKIYEMNPCNIDEKVVPWKKIIDPLIELSENGWFVNNEMKDFYIQQSDTYEILEEHKFHFKVRNMKINDLLFIISEDGPKSSMYKINGKIFNHVLLNDLKNTSLQKEDFLKYKPTIMFLNPIKFLKNEIILSDSAQNGGVSLEFVLSVLNESYGAIKSMKYQEKKLFLTNLIKLIESMRLTNLINSRDNRHQVKFSSKYILENLHRHKVVDNFLNKNDTRILERFDSSHIVINYKKNSIAITGTNNWGFGSKLFSNKFGVPYNNQFKDFHINKINKPPNWSVYNGIFIKDKYPIFAFGAAGDYKTMEEVITSIFQTFLLRNK